MEGEREREHVNVAEKGAKLCTYCSSEMPNLQS